MLPQILVVISIVSLSYSIPISEKEVADIISTKLLSILTQSYEVSHDRVDISLHDLEKKEFDQYKSLYNKVYEHIQEEESRLAVFMANKALIAAHNEQFKKGEKPYQMGINHMSDWTTDEYKTLCGFKSSTINGSSYIPLNLEKAALPQEIDWREKGAVTGIKDQGLCGSCYSFSSTGSLEGQIWRKTGKLISLSEQQIVDCDSFDYGCGGGFMANTFKYIKQVGGLMTELSYPYVSGKTKIPNEKCNFTKSEAMETDTGFVQIDKDEMLIMEAVATIGPVSIAIHAPRELVTYKSGIFYDEDCVYGQLNHALLIVGYGTDKATGMPYWIIKNSWGPHWGENGYFRMPRNVNACGISSYAIYPLV